MKNILSLLYNAVQYDNIEYVYNYMFLENEKRFEPALSYLGHVACLWLTKHRWLPVILFSRGISYDKEKCTCMMQDGIQENESWMWAASAFCYQLHV